MAREMKQLREHGHTIIEYTPLILVLVAMIVIMVLVMFGPQITGPILRK